MNSKTIAIFIILGLVFGIMISTVYHFTTEREDPENQVSTRIGDYNCHINGSYYHYSYCEDLPEGEEE